MSVSPISRKYVVSGISILNEYQLISAVSVHYFSNAATVKSLNI